jgi:hypothetical protein
LQRWPDGHRRLALVCVSLAALAPTVAAAIVQPLHEGETGDGIVEFELAGSVERAEEILDTWRSEGVLEEAAFIQGFDLLYPLIYAAALAGGCLAAGGAWLRAGRPRLADLGVPMAWVATAAIGFDYVENLGLTISLLDQPADPWPQVALVAAVLKFAAIAASLLFALSGVAASVTRSRKGYA